MNPNHFLLSKSARLPMGALVLALSGLLLLSGCATQQGTYRISAEVGRMVESKNFPPDYNYYYTGTFGEPLVLIGLKSPTLMGNDVWVNVDHAQLNQLIDNMWIYTMYSPLTGRRILDHNGQERGFYYSQWKGNPIVFDSADRVNIYLPDPDDVDRKQ